MRSFLGEDILACPLCCDLSRHHAARCKTGCFGQQSCPKYNRVIHLVPSQDFHVYMAQTEADVEDKKEELAQSLFDHIPVGVGSQGIIPTTAADLEASLEMGIDWSLREVRPRTARTARRHTSSMSNSCT